MRLSQRWAPAVMIVALACTTGCGQYEANSLAAPSPDAAPGPGPAPSVSAITVTGRVRESAPTETAGIRAATVRIMDRTAVTDGFGFYTIAGVQPGTFAIEVSAEGFVSATERVDAHRDTNVNFYLPPVQRTMTHTSTGSIASTDGTCSDGAAMRPCRILAIPVHNQGPTSATLSWSGGQQVDLDLTLFQTGTQTPLARSNDAGAGPERIATTLTGAARYEFRVTWVAGAGAAAYTLEVSYPH